jgi:hypothetical protein
MPGAGRHYFWDTIQATGDIYGANKYFCIEHPVDSNQVLMHSCVEAPRADLIYSGRCKLKAGKAVVSIDAEACPESPMLPGTFEALTRNPRVFLQNNDSFASVKGRVTGGELRVDCSEAANIEVDWMVIAERRDHGSKQSRATDSNGFLRTQHPKSDWLLEDGIRPSRKHSK